MWAEHCDCSLLYLHNGITLASIFSLFSTLLSPSHKCAHKHARTHRHTHIYIYVYKPNRKHTLLLRESVCETLSCHLTSLHPLYLFKALSNDACNICIVPTLSVSRKRSLVISTFTNQEKDQSDNDR